MLGDANLHLKPFKQMLQGVNSSIPTTFDLAVQRQHILGNCLYFFT